MSAGEGHGDEPLLRRLAGDAGIDAGEAAAALDVLFERYGDFVHNLVFRRTASWSAAEDIVGIVFLELWRQRRRLVTQGGSLRPWLVAVAINQVKRGWAGQARQRSLAERAPHPVPGADHADEVVARLDDEDRMRRLNAALADLPGPCRDVLTLWAWENLDYDEIATVLGVAVGTWPRGDCCSGPRVGSCSTTPGRSPRGRAPSGPRWSAPASSSTPGPRRPPRRRPRPRRPQPPPASTARSSTASTG
jgi:RNA polymerase sigma-70 factor (ECF subfamily)